MRAAVLPLASGLLLCGTAHSAGFDCSKASTPVEHMICSDPTTSHLDEQLSDLYSKALANAANKPALRKAQATWLKGVRDQCPSIECLRSAYSSRLSEFGTTSGGDSVSGTYAMGNSNLKVAQIAPDRIQFELLVVAPNTNTGDAEGYAKLTNSTAIFMDQENDCGIAFTFAHSGVDLSQTGTCGMGLNVSSTGIYSKVDAKSPALNPLAARATAPPAAISKTPAEPQTASPPPARYDGPPRTGKEAIARYGAAPGLPIVTSPKLVADNRSYVVQGRLKQADMDAGTMVLEFGNFPFIILLNSATSFSPGSKENLRIGSYILAVATYEKNTNAETVLGASKTVPVFIAQFIGDQQDF